MPARKNRADKYGVGRLDSREQEYLRYWFGMAPNRKLWIDADDVVHSDHGFDSGAGGLVRGLATKGFLESKTVPPDPDLIPEACTTYRLTPLGRKFVGW